VLASGGMLRTRKGRRDLLTMYYRARRRKSRGTAVLPAAKARTARSYVDQ
jgi:hypothetical protein